MNSEELTEYYEDNEGCAGAAYLRFLLMAFVCFWNYGVPEPTGFLSAASGFAIPAFYILSGYFILTADPKERQAKVVRKIKRTLKWFAILFAVYLAFNAALFLINNISVGVSKRTVFNFAVLNLWPLPVGSNIWFIQAMLYAYIVIFIAEKLRLMRFYKIVLALTIILMLVTGELAAIVRFHFLGYYYIPGNWLTRALPYMLIGLLLREKRERLFEIKNVIYIVIFIAGGVLAIGEIILLGRTGFLIYQGHMTGYGIMAFAVCALAIKHPMMPITAISYHDTLFSGLIYALMDPVFYILGLTLGRSDISLVSRFGGLMSYGICIITVFLTVTSPLLNRRVEFDDDDPDDDTQLL